MLSRYFWWAGKGAVLCGVISKSCFTHKNVSSPTLWRLCAMSLVKKLKMLGCEWLRDLYIWEIRLQLWTFRVYHLYISARESFTTDDKGSMSLLVKVKKKNLQYRIMHWSAPQGLDFINRRSFCLHFDEFTWFMLFTFVFLSSVSNDLFVFRR